MGQSYLKNAALLTGADVLLRLAGMGLRIWLANALGGEGMGLYQLVLAVYALFVTLATAGVSVAATRLMAEELARGRAQARGMLVRLARHGAAAGRGGHGGAVRAGRGRCPVVAGRCPGGRRAAGVGLRDAMDGRVGCAAGVFYRPAAGGAQRAEPAGRADRPHRHHLGRAGPGDALGWDAGRRCTAVLGATAVSEAVSAPV